MASRRLYNGDESRGDFFFFFFNHSGCPWTEGGSSAPYKLRYCVSVCIRDFFLGGGRVAYPPYLLKNYILCCFSAQAKSIESVALCHNTDAERSFGCFSSKNKIVIHHHLVASVGNYKHLWDGGVRGGCFDCSLQGLVLLPPQIVGERSTHKRIFQRLCTSDPQLRHQK